MAELDVIKRERIGGLMLRRDWGDQRPWPTWPIPDEVDLTHMSPQGKGGHPRRRLARRIDLHIVPRTAASPRRADADLSDAEIRAQGRHKSPKVLAEVRQADHADRSRPRAQEAARSCERMADICQNEQQPRLSEWHD